MYNNNRLCQISEVKLTQWFYLLCRTISQHLQMLYESFSGHTGRHPDRIIVKITVQIIDTICDDV